MAVPTWTVGQVLTASDVNKWFVPLYAYKTAATSRTSTTTLTADPHLIIAMDVNAMYDLTMVIDYEADVTGDMKWQFTLPAGAGMVYSFDAYSTADNIQLNGNNTQTVVYSAGGGGAAASRAVFIGGSITTGGTSGSVGINWAQNVSSGTATIWHQYSYMKLVRVG